MSSTVEHHGMIGQTEQRPYVQSLRETDCKSNVLALGHQSSPFVDGGLEEFRDLA
jgi:hypothetical protein